MKKIGLGLITLGFFVPAFGGIIDPTINVTLKLGIDNCYGAYSHCDVTIGGGAEVFDKDLTKGPIIQLGQLKAEMEKYISLPEVKGDMITYAFIPTEGDLAGESIRATLYNEDPGTSRLAGKNVVKIYRRLSNEKFSTLAGNLVSAKSFAQLKFIIEPNGTWKAWDPRNKQVINFLFGNTDMKPEQEPTQQLKGKE